MLDSKAAACEPWNGVDVESLVSLEEIGPSRYRSRYGDENLNGRSYGGQILGQALAAASMKVPLDRPASTIQLLFLRGADPTKKIEFEVKVLQDGRRVSSRQVFGYQQSEHPVCAAQVTFCVPQDAPSHGMPAIVISENPEDLPELSEIPHPLSQELWLLASYFIQVKACMDFRVPDIERQLSARSAGSKFRYWLRGRFPLAGDNHARSAVFAYLSDWWINFSSFGPHLRKMQLGTPLYTASLNHSLWLHRTFSPDEWMYFETDSPCAESGRGLSLARVFDRKGLILATAAQESLMVLRTSQR